MYTPFKSDLINNIDRMRISGTGSSVTLSQTKSFKKLKSNVPKQSEHTAEHPVMRKKEDVWLSTMTKTPIPTKMSKNKWQHKNATKNSITQRLQTDLGRLVWVTRTAQLVWLTGLRTQPSQSPQQPCYQKDTHLKFVNRPFYIDNRQTVTSSGELIKIDIQTA